MTTQQHSETAGGGVMETDGMAYLGRWPDCGCAVAVMVDRPDRRTETAREIANWMRTGLVIERVTVDVARGALHGCSHAQHAPKVRTNRKRAPVAQAAMTFETVL